MIPNGLMVAGAPEETRVNNRDFFVGSQLFNLFDIFFISYPSKLNQKTFKCLKIVNWIKQYYYGPILSFSNWKV